MTRSQTIWLLWIRIALGLILVSLPANGLKAGAKAAYQSSTAYATEINADIVLCTNLPSSDIWARVYDHVGVGFRAILSREENERTRSRRTTGATGEPFSDFCGVLASSPDATIVVGALPLHPVCLRVRSEATPSSPRSPPSTSA